ncbi:phosphatase PAP2 family protein [Nocardioides koreensis]
MTPEVRRRLAIRTAALAGLCYLALTIMVATGTTQHLDDAVRQWFRPDDVWGQAQIRTGPTIDALEPRRVFAVLAVVGVGASVRRRTWRPLVFTAGVALTASVLTLVSKYATDRPDPSADKFTGGSYPSGHMVADLVCMGCAAMVLCSRTRWWMWALAGLVSVAMALSLLFAAAHWFTDVLGGTLLAVAVLAAASAVPLRSALGPRPGNRSATKTPDPRSARGPTLRSAR